MPPVYIYAYRLREDKLKAYLKQQFPGEAIQINLARPKTEELMRAEYLQCQGSEWWWEYGTTGRRGGLYLKRWYVGCIDDGGLGAHGVYYLQKTPGFVAADRRPQTAMAAVTEDATCGPETGVQTHYLPA
ncbi:hypothetical protein CIB48_g6935 [Xylaria polymorpha]|nr:hypothetical protein CIB48_g6935 [Xylaria polymorpha]